MFIASQERLRASPHSPRRGACLVVARVVEHGAAVRHAEDVFIVLAVHQVTQLPVLDLGRSRCVRSDASVVLTQQNLLHGTAAATRQAPQQGISTRDKAEPCL